MTTSEKYYKLDAGASSSTLFFTLDEKTTYETCGKTKLLLLLYILKTGLALPSSSF